MAVKGYRRRVDTRCLRCRTRLILRVPHGEKSWTPEQAADVASTLCSSCCGRVPVGELGRLIEAYRVSPEAGEDVRAEYSPS